MDLVPFPRMGGRMLRTIARVASLMDKVANNFHLSLREEGSFSMSMDQISAIMLTNIKTIRTIM